MADTKISAATAVTTPAGTDEYPTNQGGASKKTTLSQIRTSLPTVPTVVSVGTEFASSATPTATLPGTHAANDILLLIIESGNQDMAAPAGYTQLGPKTGQGSGGIGTATKLMMFWKRDNGSESAPTLVDTGNHTYGVMLAIRGCPTVGDPFHFMGTARKLATSTTGTGPTGVTVIDNCLVMTVFAHSLQTTGGQASAEANADLSSITEQFDGSSTAGAANGAGLVVVTGIKATAGAFTNTTLTWAATTVDVSSAIAWLPSDAATQEMRPAEVQVFYGSPADLDDVWVKPYGARKVFAQTCDGGGSGGGGNTTTTAEGGGGGGGGGYDEAWYNADDLTGTITVHAGKGGAAGVALNATGNLGVVSEFDKSGPGPLIAARRIAGLVASASASADGGNGGCGSGRGLVSPAVATTRVSLEATTAGVAYGGLGGRGGSGTTSPVGGSPSEWGGGGGESGADTDVATASTANGYSLRGGGGGGGGRTNTNIPVGGFGGGGASGASQGAAGVDSTRLPYGGGGGVGGGSSVVTGGTGGFPGGGGGGGGGVAGGFGGAGGDGCVVVTTFFS